MIDLRTTQFGFGTWAVTTNRNKIFEKYVEVSRSVIKNDNRLTGDARRPI